MCAVHARGRNSAYVVQELTWTGRPCRSTCRGSGRNRGDPSQAKIRRMHIMKQRRTYSGMSLFNSAGCDALVVRCDVATAAIVWADRGDTSSIPYNGAAGTLGVRQSMKTPGGCVDSYRTNTHNEYLLYRSHEHNALASPQEPRHTHARTLTGPTYTAATAPSAQTIHSEPAGSTLHEDRCRLPPQFHPPAATGA
jgi:hypothetical protein